MRNPQLSLFRLTARQVRLDKRLEADPKPVRAVNKLLQTVQAKITPDSRRNLVELARLEPGIGQLVFKRIRELRPV
jgi:hypothetical protein